MKFILNFIFSVILFFPSFALGANPGVILLGTQTSEFPYMDIDNNATPDRINWLTTNGTAVSVSDSLLTGDIWGESVGWIRLNPLGGGVTNDGNGNLSGYAWGHNAGWISFDCGNGSNCVSNGNFRVTISPTTGEFSGYAWSENFGWINFACPGVSTCVQTDWTPASATTSSGGGSSGSYPACSDHTDDDGDGLIDFPNDPGCGAPTDNDETNIIAIICSDDVDNDFDGKVDYPNDPGCFSSADTSEFDSPTIPPTIPPKIEFPTDPELPIAPLVYDHDIVEDIVVIAYPFIKESVWVPVHVPVLSELFARRDGGLVYIDLISVSMTVTGISLLAIAVLLFTNLRGLVFDSESKKVLANGKIVISNLNGDIIKTITTDVNGKYSFRLKKGDYMLRVVLPEYVFPSKNHGFMPNEYFGGSIKVNSFFRVVRKNIPLDKIV